jgi:hypothetical protein
MTLQLREPVVMGAETISVIQFRKPKMKDLRKMGTQMNVDDLMTLAQLISDQPQYVFDEMSIPDGQEVMNLVAGFFVHGPQTGPK